MQIVDGLYQVRFRTQSDAALGVLVVRDGGLNGGDYGFYYRGTVVFDGELLRATLQVVRHSHVAVSMFGSMTDVNLYLSGSCTRDSFSFGGEVLGVPSARVGVHGHYLSTLA